MINSVISVEIMGAMTVSKKSPSSKRVYQYDLSGGQVAKIDLAMCTMLVEKLVMLQEK